MSGTLSPPNPQTAPPSAGASPGQPPIGSSPATGPTQNLGLAAQGIQAAGALLNAMARLIPAVGPATPIGQAIAKAMVDIGKHVQPGSTTPQGEMNFAQRMVQTQQQMMPQRAAMAAMQRPPAPPQPGA